MELKHKKRAGTVVRRIWELFSPYQKVIKRKKKGPKVIHSFRKEKVSASESIPKVGGSKVTQAKARFALGVKSVKIKKNFYWLRPTFTLQKALNRARGESKSTIYGVGQSASDKYLSAYTRALTEIMEKGNFDLKATEVLTEVRTAYKLYKPALIYQIKKELDIRSIKEPDGWHWVWPSPQSIAWLRETLLSRYETAQEVVLKKAEKEKKWHSRLVLASRMKMGGEVVVVKKNGVAYWRDINFQPERDSQNQPYEEMDVDEVTKDVGDWVPSTVGGCKKRLRQLRRQAKVTGDRSAYDRLYALMEEKWPGSTLTAEDRIEALEKQISLLLKEKTSGH